MTRHTTSMLSRSALWNSGSVIASIFALPLTTLLIAAAINISPVASEAQVKPTTSSVDSAISLRVGSYQIQLRAERGWAPLRTRHLKRLSTAAVAGALHDHNVAGFVLIESAKRLALSDYARTVLENSTLRELVIEEVEEFTYQGRDALKVTYSGDNGAQRFRYLNYIFLLDGQGYQVASRR